MNFDGAGVANGAADEDAKLSWSDHPPHKPRCPPEQLLWLLTLVLPQCQLNTVVAVASVAVAVDAAAVYRATLYVCVFYTVVFLCDFPS